MFPAIDLSQAQAPGEGEAYWLIGTLVTIKVAGELTGNALSVTEHQVPVGGGLPPHIHHVEDEILYVLDGEIAGRCGAQPLRAGQGSTVFLPRGVPHAWRAEGGRPARLLIVTTPAGFERFCAAAGDEAPVRALPAGPVESAAMVKLLAVAPQYGLELLKGTN
jgi:quercetin dioxygenase-like cupin family protein